MDKVKDRLMTVLLCYNFLQKKKNKNLFLFSSIIYLTFISRFDFEPHFNSCERCSCYRLRTALAANHRGGPHLTPAYKNISAVPMGQRIYLVGRGGVREIVMGNLSFSTISNLSAASIASPLSFQ